MAIHESVMQYDFTVICTETKQGTDECFSVGEKYAVDEGHVIDDNGQRHMVYCSRVGVFSNFSSFEA